MHTKVDLSPLQSKQKEQHAQTLVSSLMKNPFISHFLVKYFKYILLAILVYFPVFQHLTKLAVRIFDESRLANNAVEMYRFGNYIVTHYDGSPEMWNTKPPLMIWFQVLCMKIFGPGDFAVRFPSAIAAVLICGILLFISQRYLKSFWFGFIAVLVLVTSPGFVGIHGTRTGDYDVLLTFFTTFSCIMFFEYCESKYSRYLYLFFAGLALAALTKGVAGLMFLPAIALYSLVAKQFIPLLKNKHFYIGAIAFILTIAAYYGFREILNPGYLAGVYNNELGGRYMEVNEGHVGGAWFYYDNLYYSKFSAWFLLIPCGIMIGLFHKNSVLNRLTFFCILMAITFLFIISKAETKLEWYDIPLYPFLSILVAIFLFFAFDFLSSQDWIKKQMKFNIIPFVFLFFVALTPYKDIVLTTFMPEEISQADKDFYELSYYLKNALKGQYDVDGKVILYEGYHSSNRFYSHVLQDKGVNIAYKESSQNLVEGDIVIAVQPNIKQLIEETYQHEKLEEVGNIVTYKINGRN